MNITNPNGISVNYILNNITNDTWSLNNFTDYVNGTYNYNFIINYSNGGVSEESGTFGMFINFRSQIRTLRDSYVNQTSCSGQSGCSWYPGELAGGDIIISVDNEINTININEIGRINLQ